MPTERITESEQQTIDFGASLGRHLTPGDIITLRGDLGAGKTRFVRGMAQGMGIDPNLVSSPTFVLVNIYENQTGPRLAHVDAYRMQHEDSLDELGWDRIDDGNTVIAIEWPERLPGALEERAIAVHLAHADTDAEHRRIRITTPADRVLAL